MKTRISLLIGIAVLTFSISHATANSEMASIKNGWQSKPITVKNGGETPDVMQLLRAFHATWPTTAAKALIAETGDRRFVTNDVTECDDCSGNVFVDCDDFNCVDYDNGIQEEQHMRARTYHRNNGHTLFAICIYVIVEGETPVCCFYDYDPATMVMTPEEVPFEGFQREWEGSMYHVNLGLGYDQTIIVEEWSPDGLVWFHHYAFDGMKHVFHHSGENSYNEGDEDEWDDEGLPEDAELKDENGEMQVYLSPEVFVEVTDDEWSIWLKDKESGEVTFVLTTNSNAEPRWNMMTDGNAIPVSPNMIAVGDCYNCLFIPWDPDKIFIEGCPDGRNVWSYIINVKTMETIQLPTNEGLVSIDPEGRKIHMSNSMYHQEGGRYSIERVYTEDGKFTGEENRIPD